MSPQVASWIQYLGLAIAMLGGAPWPRPNWWVVAAGLVVVSVGIALKRAADRRDPRHAPGDGEGVREGSIPAAAAALPAMLTQVRALAAEAATRPLEELAAQVEQLQQRGTEQVAAAQDAFVRAHGFPGYARVMGPLASGERLLYRAWSAASDGHRPETVASLEAALPYLEEALEALESLTGVRRS
jgi:hypothetical protein